MEIKLNSPKYAEAQSLQYQMYKKQTDRKKRKNFVPELFERYFRRNEGTTDYATIPEVTLAGDFVLSALVLGTGNIVSTKDAGNFRVGYLGTDLLIGVGGSDRATFDGSLIDHGVIQEFILSRVGSVFYCSVGGVALNQTGGAGSNDTITFDSIYKTWGQVTSVPNWSGILVNLKIWDNGTLIRDYPLDDNSDDLRELASGQNGTVINGNASDWGLFQQQVTGEWLGQELVVNGEFDTDSDWTLGAGWSISGGIASLATASSFVNLRQDNVTLDNTNYRTTFTIAGYSSGNIQLSLGGGVDSMVRTGIGTFIEDLTTNTANQVVVYNSTTGADCSIDNVSVKEVLNVA